jgi:ferric-dicitrate binding protein FerR (iron transport regulator)
MTPEQNKANPPLSRIELAELKELIVASSDRSLLSSESERLQQMLAASREARSVYMSYRQLDANLDWKVRGNQSVDAVVESSRRAANLAKELNLIDDRDRLAITRKRSLSVFALAAALCCVAASIVWLWPRSADHAAEMTVSGTTVLAKVVQLSTDCSWFVENRRGDGDTVFAGDKVRLIRGQLRMDFACGATVTMRSPAALEIISPMKTRAVLGTLKAHVGKGAEGFTVETPRTTVVDLGTDFGVDVSRHGSTDVVVFNGAVDLHSEGINGLSESQRLSAGEGVRVSGEGTASRIVSILDSQFSVAEARRGRDRTPVISEVRDNVRRGESWKYYEIVHGGLREDAKAFVDREHEWNGVTSAGIPRYLLGADYVKTFNDDKLNREVEIRLAISRAAIVYVLLDKRSPVPDWLRDRFFNTGDEIGLDGGKYSRFGERKFTATGAGKSIDDVFSIWRLDVPRAATVTLGAIQPGGEAHNMFGIVAVPMESRSRDDFGGIATNPTKESSPLVKGSNGELSADGMIERANDCDVFRFDWKGGVAEVNCRTNGYTTLDPIVSIYDPNEKLIGYARATRQKRERATVKMNLPAGTFYAAITGSDEVGEVGYYHLDVKPAKGDIPAPLATSSSFVVRATPADHSIKLSWDAVPAAKSYVVERSYDAVNFETIAKSSTSSIETALEPGTTCIYRVKAEAAGIPASAPLLARAPAAAVSRLQTFGCSPESIVLEWSDVMGEQGYQVERSQNGEPFVNVATVPRNACGYRDTTVAPNSRYAYRVITLDPASTNAVSRSISAMSGVAGLSAVARGNDQVELTWKASYPQARLYIERATGAPDLFLTIGAVNGEAGSFIDRSVHAGEQPRYRVVAVEDRIESTETRSEQVDSVRLPDWVAKEDFFALRFIGKINVPKRGKFSFFLNSDDGSRLFIDGSMVANNDERHSEQMVAGFAQLKAGLHDLEVQYFQHDGNKKLELLWAGAGVPYSEVSKENLTSLVCRRYSGKWWRLPFDRSCAISDVVEVKKPFESGAASQNSGIQPLEKIQ